MGVPKVHGLILYNGASGSLGRYMAPALARRGLAGHALSARLEDRAATREELARLEQGEDPVLILMAARVSVPACQADPEGAYRINVTATLETVTDFVDWAYGGAVQPRLLYVSTGHVYAEQPAGTRISEAAATAPRSVYATTKLQAEEALRRAAGDLGFDLTIARLFGLMAPIQPANYLLPGLIARVREGRLAQVPGLDYVRDYLDARDVCDDLVMLMTRNLAGQDTEGLVNVCSGEGVTIHEVLDSIIAVAAPEHASDLMARVSAAPGRPDDIDWIVGDPSTYIRCTGMEPRTISLRDTITDALAHG